MTVAGRRPPRGVPAAGAPTLIAAVFALLAFSAGSVVPLPRAAAAPPPRVTDLDASVTLAPLARKPFSLAGVASIHLAADATHAEKVAADVLRRALDARFGVRLAVRDSLPVGDDGAIVVGRAFATATHLVAAAEFAALQAEGFVIKAGGNRAVISGADPAGTVYGVFAFLRRFGWQSAPLVTWGDVEGWAAGAPDRLPAFATAARPFFERRDGGRPDDGRYGATLRQFALGDLHFAQNEPLFKDHGYLGWDHTAGYLLPLGLYRDSHPEFYARLPSGEPIPESTPTLRVKICPCSADAVRLSSERLLGWIAQQPQARWFAVTDGDGWGSCPQCAATDPSPDSATDRVLRWLNGVADIVGRTDPGKTLYTLAYTNSLEPPLAVHTLAANGLVMYCPEFGHSRSTSAVGFEHPLNVVAMEELIGWLQQFPDQMGIYDYAGDTQFGFDDKVKAFAKEGVRWYYINSLHDPLADFTATRLRFDPFLDSERLRAEFTKLSYGPAAAVMDEYLQVKRATIDERSRVSRHFFADPLFLSRVRPIVDRLEAAARGADAAVAVRILDGALDAQLALLRGEAPGIDDPGRMRADLSRFASLAGAELAAAVRAQMSEKAMVILWRRLGGRLALLHVTLPDPSSASVDIADRVEILERATAALADTAAREAERARVNGAQAPVAVAFAATPGEASAWRTETTMAGGSPPARVGEQRDVTGASRPAVIVAAPMTRLPEVARGSRMVHGGRFYAERVFERPIDLGARRYVDIHLAASTAVPVTIYLGSDFPVKSSVMLGPGEQIVRIDLAQMDGRDVRDPDLPPRSGYLRTIGFDFWPQDVFFPHPPARDVTVALFGLSASDDEPRPDRLPDAGRVVWLTEYRPYTTFTRSLSDLDAQMAQRGRAPGGAASLLGAYGMPAQTEGPRTFTEHRILAPLAAIRTGGAADAGERDAAEALQRRLAAMFGISLPIDPDGAPPVGPDTANAILVGRAATAAAGVIGERDRAFVGEHGFVIRARQNRVALSGADAEGAMYAVARYLEDHGARFAVPGSRETLPDRRASFLHELVVLDWPSFPSRPLPCGALLMAQQPARAWDGAAARSGAQAIADSRALAERIKTAARRGRTAVGLPDLAAASSSPLACYVAAKLLWDPFADPSRLVRDFEDASRHGVRP